MNVKSTTITLKDSNVDLPLPSKFYVDFDKAYKNLQSYLPKDFQFDAKVCDFSFPWIKNVNELNPMIVQAICSSVNEVCYLVSFNLDFCS